MKPRRKADARNPHCAAQPLHGPSLERLRLERLSEALPQLSVSRRVQRVHLRTQIGGAAGFIPIHSGPKMRVQVSKDGVENEQRAEDDPGEVSPFGPRGWTRRDRQRRRGQNFPLLVADTGTLA